MLFAGAGVSVSPPAGLPNWLNLRDWTLAAVAGRAGFLSPYLTHLTNMEMLTAPGQKGMTPEVVASEIANQCRPSRLTSHLDGYACGIMCFKFSIRPGNGMGRPNIRLFGEEIENARIAL